MKLKVQDRPTLYRDSSSKAIVVEDRDALQRYLSERDYRHNLSSSNKSLESQIETLNDEVAILKKLVEQLIRDR